LEEFNVGEISFYSESGNKMEEFNGFDIAFNPEVEEKPEEVLEIVEEIESEFKIIP